MKINTNTIINNFKNEPFTIKKDGKDVELTVGDVLFAELSAAAGVPLKTSWKLLPELAKENNEFEISEDEKKTLLKVVENSAQKSAEERFNLIVYGRLLEILG